MTLRKIAEIGHPILREAGAEVDADALATTEVQSLIDDLVETMRDAHGAGLAAPQIHASLRICAIEVHDNPRYPYKPEIPLLVLVNPSYEPLSEVTFDNDEGCLSVPNLRGTVRRHAEIRVRSLDREGRPLVLNVRGVSAGTFQHEIDHLDGILFVDRIEDPTTMCTWETFRRYREAAFRREVEALVARWGSGLEVVEGVIGDAR